MQLSPGQLAKLLEQIRATWKPDAFCDACGNEGWNVNPTIYELREFQQGGLSVGGVVSPVIMVTCKNCGYVRLISAVVAGVVDNTGEPRNG